MSVAARVGLLITVLTLILCVLSRPQIRSSREPLPARATVAAAVAQPTSDDENSSVVRPGDAEGAVDLYGNEVTDAVAKYGLDATGDLYELHSPQTELPRLKSPKS